MFLDLSWTDSKKKLRFPTRKKKRMTRIKIHRSQGQSKKVSEYRVEGNPRTNPLPVQNSVSLEASVPKNPQRRDCILEPSRGGEHGERLSPRASAEIIREILEKQ